MVKSKAIERGSSTKRSKKKRRKDYLKEEFGAIVEKKDDDILALIDENESLRQHMEVCSSCFCKFMQLA